MSHDLTSFEEQVIKRSHEVPVLVDFWADWCGPCLMFSPILEKAVAEAEGAWELVKVNTEQHPEISERYAIRSLPTLKLFVAGEECAESLGVLTEPHLLRWISNHLPSPSAADLEAAEKALAAGEASSALEKVHAILATEPENEKALFLRIRATFATDPAGVAALVITFPEDSAAAAQAHGLRDLATLLTTVPGTEAGTVPGTEAGDLTDLLSRGIEALRKLDFAPACEAFLLLLEKDRLFGNEAAAKYLKQIFLYLGPRHEVTDKFQRRFASLLFS